VLKICAFRPMDGRFENLRASRMTELLTAAQMRAIEQAAIASGEVTGLELMERAGRGVVEAIFEEWPELKAGSFRAVVLCGPGNNGGDGFVVARLLKGWGWEVEVFLYGDPERLPPDARVNYERWCGLGEVALWNPASINSRGPAIFVDAVFGTGLTRQLPPEISEPLLFLSTRNRVSTKTVSVDMPSGVCSDSGRFLGVGRLRADLTVTFHRAKVGHLLGFGARALGALRIAGIGLSDFPSALANVHICDADYLGLSDARELGPLRLYVELDKGGFELEHKYTHGHALILSGGPGKGGAARLGARGALRIGAGLVTVGCPPEALAENAAQLNAIMQRPFADAAALAEVLQDNRINALCLGPGLGVDRARALLSVALGQGAAKPRPTVLDADALTAMAAMPNLFAALHEECVLTPHAGEFARLFPDIAAKLEAPATRGPAYSKVDATREAAKRAGCVVLYKGPDTVIADPSGRCSINSAQYDRAAPWLATAGSGDVLAGFITGLLARGFAPMQAAETGAWLHVECARAFGPGLIAEDLPDQLPGVFRSLGL
jgi:ADP-dependent NAD(P)H-hydrate dehydratase / NAD(P)H-hydrate epimerase